MGSGYYSKPVYVMHSDGRIYEYFIDANPRGNDSVDLCRKLIEDGNGNRNLAPAECRTERIDGFECKGGTNVREDGSGVDWSEAP